MTRILAAIIAALAFSFTIAGPARAGASSPTCRDPFYCAPPAPCSPTTCPIPVPTTCAHNSPDPTMCDNPTKVQRGHVKWVKRHHRYHR